MSGQADRLAAKSLQLLERYGVTATLTRRGAAPYEPGLAAPQPWGASATTYPVQVLVQADTSGTRRPGDEPAPEATAVVSRRKLLVAAKGLPVTPEVGDEVGPLEGRSWRVVRVDPPVQLSGQPILFTLGVAS